MKRIAFSPAAVSYLEPIWDYSAANWGVDQADNYLDMIQEPFVALAGGRTSGCPVDIRAGYRKQKAGSRLVYYRDGDDRIAVIRVLHARQDVERNRPGQE